MGEPIDAELLREFEAGLDPRRPELSRMPARIIGYGEISTIFEIAHPALAGYAFKRMPLFRSVDEMSRYETLYEEYDRLIRETIHIEVPESLTVRVLPERGNLIVYIAQRRLPSASIGNQLLHHLDDDAIGILVSCLLKEMKRVWRFNGAGSGVRIGFDGQISNWALRGYDGSVKPRIGDDAAFYYFDTSTPLMTRDGVEQLDPELFLRSAPSFLVWLIRWLFLEDVMTRYYDFHLVAVDLIANFYKEQRPDLVGPLVDRVNDFFRNDAPELAVAAVTEKEVRAYYREDAMIWRLYLALRRFDRFLHRAVLRKPYVYILPGRIKR
ncbi:MAG: hypothetical protein JXO48_04460 [Deltaproteobacteria bacterium]|nr:hypothetical protein [Deltaproteobacteria bacterium]